MQPSPSPYSGGNPYQLTPISVSDSNHISGNEVGITNYQRPAHYKIDNNSIQNANNVQNKHNKM